MSNQIKTWTALSAIDVTPFVKTEVLEGVTYLPWMEAHSLMMDYNPAYSWEFQQDAEGRELHYLNDGSAEVRITMIVDGLSQTTSLPLYHKDKTSRELKAIENPSAWDLNTAKQRARVRAMAGFGLGYELFKKTAQEPVFKDEQPPEVVENEDIDHAARLWSKQKVESADNLQAAVRKRARYLNGLRNLGVSGDPFEAAWNDLVAAKGWVA